MTREIKSLLEVRSNVQKVQVPNYQFNYLTRKQVADHLHICTMTVHNWTKCGILNPYRIGKRILYKADEVREAVEKMNGSPAK